MRSAVCLETLLRIPLYRIVVAAAEQRRTAVPGARSIRVSVQGDNLARRPARVGHAAGVADALHPRVLVEGADLALDEGRARRALRKRDVCGRGAAQPKHVARTQQHAARMYMQVVVATDANERQVTPGGGQ